MNEKNIIWEHAGKAGLVLGGVSILYMVLTALTGKLAENAGSGLNILLTLVNFLLWIAKFGACIYLMRLFMQRFAKADPAADNNLPSFSFFVNLIYCWLFGTVLSAILSRNIPSRNPFTDEQ